MMKRRQDDIIACYSAVYIIHFIRARAIGTGIKCDIFFLFVFEDFYLDHGILFALPRNIYTYTNCRLLREDTNTM